MPDESDSWLEGIGVTSFKNDDSGDPAPAPETPQGAQDAPQGAQDAPQGAQDAPQDAQDAPQDAQDAPQDAQDAPPPAGILSAATAAVASPQPDPGIFEEIEGAVESGVRQVVKTGAEVVEETAAVVEEAAPVVETGLEIGAVATVAPALVVAGGIGAAVFLWSKDAGAAWDGQTNPETGKPYTSQEEYDRVQASIRDQRKNAQPLAPPVPGVDYDDPDRPQPASCSTLFPSVPICSGQGGFENEDDAARAEPDWGKVARSVSSSMSDYANLPGGQNSHKTYYDKDDNKLFTLVKTPCCTDTPNGPVLTWHWTSAN